MPCNCDHLEPTAIEQESRDVARYINILFPKLGLDKPLIVNQVANNVYGMKDLADELTALLCAAIRGMTEEQQMKFIWDGRVPINRELAAWWDKHRKADQKKARISLQRAADDLRYAELSRQWSPSDMVIIKERLS